MIIEKLYQVNKFDKLSVIILASSLVLSGCAQTPESTVVDGVKIAKSKDELSSDDADKKKGEEDIPKVQSVSEVLESFPQRYTNEFSNGNNQLTVDADIIVPDVDEKFYCGKVEMEQWDEEKTQDFTQKLLEANLITEDYPIEVFHEDRGTIPLVSLAYANNVLSAWEKSGESVGADKNSSSEQRELFCAIFSDYGISIGLEPYSYDSENDGENSYNICQIYEGVQVASGFPATDANEVIPPGGNISFSEAGIIDFNIFGMVTVTEREVCQNLSTMEEISTSLQKAVDNYEILFSEKLKAVRFELEYLIKSESGQILMIPVWNVTFDVEGYYQFLDENPDERENSTMMNLCINAIDGSIAYAM